MSVNARTVVRLGPETTANEFVADIRNYEHRLLIASAAHIADLVSFTEEGAQTKEALLGETSEDGSSVDGLRVKAAWVSSAMFNVLSKRQSREGGWDFQKISDYQASIASGLQMRQVEAESGVFDGDPSEEPMWEKWV
ncbi:hypothetical protein IAR50_003726 [Cryptococcus sp. DSM 104548]